VRVSGDGREGGPLVKGPRGCLTRGTEAPPSSPDRLVRKSTAGEEEAGGGIS